jgi:hypothetical protein
VASEVGINGLPAFLALQDDRQDSIVRAYT